MAKKNYKAWNINPKEFPASGKDKEKLLFFARYGVLAPSGHNSQPWQLKLSEDNIVVSVNPDHFLSADGSGLLSAEPYISIGTFLEVFMLSARGFGYEIDINLLPDTEKIAKLSIKGKITPEPELLSSIVKRTSNRNYFKKDTLDQRTLSKIIAQSLKGVQSTLLIAKDDIEFIAEQTEKGIGSIMGKPEYRRELSGWVRTNQTFKYDGMPGFTHGFGDLKSLLSKIAVRYGPKNGPEAEKSAELIRNSGALVIVHCENEAKESFINAGRLFSHICVMAYKSNLAASALGASVLDKHTRENVKKRFEIKDRPLFVLRLGKPTMPAPHSPRWPLEKVLS